MGKATAAIISKQLIKTLQSSHKNLLKWSIAWRSDASVRQKQTHGNKH
jgi:hypothetical protein